jgi:phycobilisome core component
MCDAQHDRLGSTLWNDQSPAATAGWGFRINIECLLRGFWGKNFMRDAVTSLIRTYDVTGRYFDRNAMDTLKSYFETGNARVKAASVITSNAAAIVKQAGLRLFDELPELIRPGGNAYTTRRYAACLRDMDYFLRYASYALVAGDTDVLDERVLEGLRETYNSLSVQIGPTVRGIQIMKELVKDQVAAAGIEKTDFLDQPFDYMTRELGENNL